MNWIPRTRERLEGMGWPTFQTVWLLWTGWWAHFAVVSTYGAARVLVLFVMGVGLVAFVYSIYLRQRRWILRLRQQELLNQFLQRALEEKQIRERAWGSMN